MTPPAIATDAPITRAGEMRPRSWRRLDELTPCGETGGLTWHYACGVGIFDERMCGPPDLSDCLVVRPNPFRIVIWEPLQTNAPGPHLAHAHCCYINTVIFYAQPYVINCFKRWWRSAEGWRESKTGSFVEWDSIETRLTWDDQVIFSGERFVKGGGRVLWANAPGERRRWWMRHQARREAHPSGGLA